MSRARTMVAAGLAVALAGCATIVHGNTQDIRVTSQPSGAVVRVSSLATTTPGVLKLDRKGIHTLVFEKTGYRSVEVTLNRTVDGWMFGNILFGGIIGLVIDFVSGSAYKLTPGEVSAVLGEMQASRQNLRRNDVVVFVDFERVSPAVRERLKDHKIS